MIDLPFEIGSFAEPIYENMEPVAKAEPGLNWPLATYIGALGQMFQDIEDMAREQNGYPGYSQLVDVNRVRADRLPWLAQFIGAVLPQRLPGETDEAYVSRMRGFIKDPSHFKRGSVAMITWVAQQRLTGTRSVYIRERDTSPYHYTVVTRTSETPDPAGTLADLKAAKPAGLILAHNLVAGWDWFGVDGQYASWDALNAAHTSWNDLQEGP